MSMLLRPQKQADCTVPSTSATVQHVMMYIQILFRTKNILNATPAFSPTWKHRGQCTFSPRNILWRNYDGSHLGKGSAVSFEARHGKGAARVGTQHHEALIAPAPFLTSIWPSGVMWNVITKM